MHLKQKVNNVNLEKKKVYNLVNFYTRFNYSLNKGSERLQQSFIKIRTLHPETDKIAAEAILFYRFYFSLKFAISLSRLLHTKNNLLNNELSKIDNSLSLLGEKIMSQLEDIVTYADSLHNNEDEVVFVKDYNDKTFSHERVFTGSKNLLTKEEEEKMIKHALMSIAENHKPQLCIKVNADSILDDKYHPGSILDSYESDSDSYESDSDSYESNILHLEVT